uniref:Uncharacterized protein n=1 Tax=Glossina palpalis gambiensis TaxID=67801 RepID=A0A1B0BSG5_9MUSC
MGRPRSSFLGPKNIRTVPKRCAPPLLFTLIVYNATITSLGWINQMPMPMMNIQADVFAKIPQTMLWIQIRGGIVTWYHNWHTKMSIKRPAAVLCFGINKENCSSRPTDIGMRISGTRISRTGTRLSAFSPKRARTSLPTGR